MYIIQCTLYIIHHALYNIHFAIHNIYLYILIGWQAYRGDQIQSEKTALHNPEVKSK